MAETNILNPTVTWRRDIDDALGPDFGFEQLRRSQLAMDKAAFGQPFALTVGNGGHTTQFSWLNRSRRCAEYLKRWAEQYEDGFFTIIDHDWRGRHYVGRFTGDMPIVAAGNDRYNLQGWTFEEIPGVPMLRYPGEWEHWAIKLPPVNDFGELAAATFSAAPGAWQRPPAVADSNGVLRVPRQVKNLTPTNGDWAAHQYRGYGFRLWLRVGPGSGVVQIYVDGVLAQDNVVLTSGVDLGPVMVYKKTDLPLGVHVVKVVIVPATPPREAGLQGFLWDKIEVMR